MREGRGLIAHDAAYAAANWPSTFLLCIARAPRRKTTTLAHSTTECLRILTAHDHNKMPPWHEIVRTFAVGGALFAFAAFFSCRG